MESKKLNLLLSVAILIALLGIGGCVLLWTKLQKIETGTVVQADETSRIVSELGKVLILPKGEVPDLMTVNNLDQVAGQPFFANAQVGDKVLVYRHASKAILWRPGTHQIVEVYPINLTAQ